MVRSLKVNPKITLFPHYFHINSINKGFKMIILRNSKNEFVYSFKNYRDALNYAQHNNIKGFKIES